MERLMVNYEDLKPHIAEVERCQQHPQTKSVPSVPFIVQSLRNWNPATQTRRSPTREHHKQHRHPHLRCLPPSPHLHQFPHDLQQQPAPELHSRNNFVFKGKGRLMEMAKWVLAEPTTDTVSAWDELISSCRITLFSDISWNSNTWLSIAGFTSPTNVLCTHYNFDEFVCQQWSQHDISRNRWGTKLKISSFQNCAFLDLFTH